MMTDDEPTNGSNHLATMAQTQNKILRLAVIVTIVAVTTILYFIWVSSTRADDVNDRDKEIARLVAENKALVEENVTLESNLEQLKVHVISLTAIIEELSGAENHTETSTTTTATTVPPVVEPTTVPTTPAIPDDSIHAGLPPDASNPHGG